MPELNGKSMPRTTSDDPQQALDIAAKAAAPALTRRMDVAAMSDKVRKVFDELIDHLVEQWSQAMKASTDRMARVKATDKFHAETCALLQNIKQLNGGELPDDLLKLWVENGCG